MDRQWKAGDEPVYVGPIKKYRGYTVRVARVPKDRTSESPILVRTLRGGMSWRTKNKELVTHEKWALMRLAEL